MKPQLIIFVMLSLLFSNCCGTRMSQCPDTRPVSFPKSETCAMKIYKDAIREFSLNLKATVNVVDAVTVGVDSLQIKNKAILLKEKLTQESIRLQETLKSSYLAITRDPCNNSTNHYKLLESVNAKNYELQELKVKLKEKGFETIKGYLYQRGRKEGAAMKIITTKLDEYYTNNNSYPETLEEIDAQSQITLLGKSRLEYKKINSEKHNLKFAGEDYALNTSDDRNYTGDKGKTKE